MSMKHFHNRLAIAAASCALVAFPAQGASSRRRTRRQKMPKRLGIVVFQFDDGSIGHYTHAFRILE